MTRLSSSSPVTASDEVGRTRDPGALEHVDLGRVAEQHLVPELLLELLVAVRPLLDERHLVAHVSSERATFAPTLPPPATIAYVHQLLTVRARPRRRTRTASVSTEIAVCVGQTVCRPRCGVEVGARRVEHAHDDAATP